MKNLILEVEKFDFPYHLQRGFETITIAKQETVYQTKSLGYTGRFSNSYIQRFTTEKGVPYSKMFALLKKNEGNSLEIFQIWLNSPKKNKMVKGHHNYWY